MKQLVDLQDKYEVYALIVDYHALKSVQDKKVMRENIKEVLLLGLGQSLALSQDNQWLYVGCPGENCVYAYKLITDIEGKRIEMLQKAGLLENNELANDLMEAERKQEILMGILKEVTSDCDHCKVEVARRLGKITNRVEEIIVED